MHLPGSGDQGAKHHRCGARIVQGGVGRRHIEAQLLHQPGQPGRLSLRELQHEPGQGGGVDDRVLERAFEPPSHQPAVESVVAVLDQDGAVSEAQECPSGVAELGRPDQHRTVDVMAPARVRVDRRAAVNECVEECERPGELETLGAQLQDQERCVASRLDVDRDELRIVQQRLRAQLGLIDGDLLPGDRLSGPARLEEDRLRAQRAGARARRAQPISSVVNARSSNTAPQSTATPTRIGIARATPPMSRSG